MQIENYTEKAVRTEVARIKTGKAPDGCWCPLCEADTICLALGALPPFYGRNRRQGIMEEERSAGYIRTAVEMARNRVSTNPRHGKVTGGFPLYEIDIVNYLFDEGIRLIYEILNDDSSRCTCDHCQADTLAFAMNRIPPLYGVSFSGRTSFAPLRKEYVRQDLRKVIRAAAIAVTSHPRHQVSYPDI